MLTHNFLTLRLVRLKPGEEWQNEENGLSFVFAKAGHGNYLAGSAAQAICPGDVLVVNGAPRGKLCVGKSSEVLFHWFSVNLEQLYPLFAADEIGSLQTVCDIFRKVRVYPSSTPIAKECRRLLEDIPPQFNLDHRGHVLRVAASVLNCEFRDAKVQRSGVFKMEEHIAQVLESLSIDEILNLSVGELAAKFNCSRRHLNRLFHQYFGLSVAALRMEMRLLKAVSLLRDPSAKIINVAEQCGFNHLGLFNTCFRKRFGSSPGEWRKAHLSDPGATKSASAIAAADPNCRVSINGLCPWAMENGDGRGNCPRDQEGCAARPRPQAGNGNGNGNADSGEPAFVTKTGITFRVRV